MRALGAALGATMLVASAACSDDPLPTAKATASVVLSAAGNEPIDDPYDRDVDDGAIQLELETVAEGKGLTAPVWGTYAPGQPGLLYVADQDGPLWAVDLASGAKTLCLNTRPLLVPLGAFGPDTYDERGFLGVAFHPDFATNGLVYTYTSEGDQRFGQPNHTSVIREWRIANPHVNPLTVRRTDDDRGEGVCGATMARIVYAFEQPQFNHNGGAIFFGTRAGDRNLLYVTSGDGGCADDQNLQTGFQGETCIGHGPNSELTEPNRFGNGQRLDTPLGKVLRIDPRTRSASLPAIGNGSFMPGDVYAYGFRNPYRGSADRGTGVLWVADVGQNKIEEVDVIDETVVPSVASRNYGWHLKEGRWLFDPNRYEIDFASDGFIFAFSPGFPADMIDPVAEYDHDDGVAVVGGFVYRGTRISALQGHYVFGDYSDGINSSNGRVFYYDATARTREGAPPSVHNLVNGHINRFVLGFGEDARGELYVLGNKAGIPFEETGIIMKIVQRCRDGRDCRD